MSQQPTSTSQKDMLPDWHRGYIEGILDCKGLLESIASKPVPPEIANAGNVTMADTFEVFKGQFAAIAKAFDTKAKEAERIAVNTMLSGGQGGVA